MASTILPNDFDWEFYLNYHKDLIRVGFKTKEQAVNHYLKHGHKEKRLYKPTLPNDFDWESYLLNNEDLRKNGINNKEKAIRHYLRHGICERRSYEKKNLININNTKIVEEQDWIKFFKLKNNLEFEKKIETIETKTPIYLFYHIYAKNDWKDIFREQIEELKISKLLYNYSKFFINIYGENEDVEYVKNYLNHKNIIINKVENFYEFPTLDLIHNISNLENFKGLYFHTKSSSYSINNKDKEIFNFWRKFMNYQNINCWRNCYSLVHEFDIVGTLFKKGTESIDFYWEKLSENIKNFEFTDHFSGNFWWFDSSYYKNLPVLNSEQKKKRHNAEWYIFFNKPKYFDFTNSKKYFRSILNDILYERSKKNTSLSYSKNKQDNTINLITDSINEGSLYGGVMTSIVLAVLISNQTKRKLRLITLNEPPNKDNLYKVLKNNNIEPESEIEFFFTKNNTIEFSDSDVFLTTSWWSTDYVLQNINPEQVFYLLQEDERMFYPNGHERVMCENIMKNEKIKFIINTEILYNFLVQNGFDNIKRNGIFFEPSFIKHNISNNKNHKKRLLFYARPNNVRNLFKLGIELIKKIIIMEFINPDEWEIVFVGKDLKNLDNSFFTERKFSIEIYENLQFENYLNIIENIDIAISLMYTPHPSYPPLDVVACGNIVLTNTYENKINLDNYSKNIVCSEPNLNSLISGFESTLKLLENKENRLDNYKNNNILKNWKKSFKDVLLMFKN